MPRAAGSAVEPWTVVHLPREGLTVISRFQGDRGRALLIEELGKARISSGIAGLPEALAEAGALHAVETGRTLIEQNDADNDFFIIAGVFGVFVNGKEVAKRTAGDCIGEMATVSPIQKRAASMVADEDSVVLKISEEAFSGIATRFPDVWRRIAQDVARRLEQRNLLIRKPNDKVRVFVISSVAAPPV